MMWTIAVVVVTVVSEFNGIADVSATTTTVADVTSVTLCPHVPIAKSSTIYHTILQPNKTMDVFIEFLQKLIILSSTYSYQNCFVDDDDITICSTKNTTTTVMEESLVNVNDENIKVVGETRVSIKRHGITPHVSESMNYKKTRRPRRRNRKKRTRKQHYMTKLQLILNASFLQNIFSSAVDGLLRTLLHPMYERLPQLWYIFHVVLYNWMTTTLFHIQQFWNRHNIIVSQLMTFIIEQSVDDDPKHHRQRKQMYQKEQYRKYDDDNVHIRQLCTDLTSNKVDHGNIMTTEVSNPTSALSGQFIRSKLANDSNIVMSCDVVGDVEVVQPNFCRTNSNMSTIPIPTTATMTIVPPLPTQTSCIKPYHTDTGTLLWPNCHSTTIVEHNTNNTSRLENVTMKYRCSVDWHDTMTAFMIRLTMIAIMCYFIAISQ